MILSAFGECLLIDNCVLVECSRAGWDGWKLSAYWFWDVLDNWWWVVGFCM